MLLLRSTASNYSTASWNNFLQKKEKGMGIVAICVLIKFWNTPSLRRGLRQIFRNCSWSMLTTINISKSLLLRNALNKIYAPGFLQNIFQKLKFISSNEDIEALNTGKEKGSTEEMSMVEVIKRHRSTIDSILLYWFGQGTPDTSQKRLWMIASSSKEHLQKVDADIVEKFQTLFGELSDECSDTRNAWCDCKDEIYGWQGKLASIIILDQISRHIHRYYSTENIGDAVCRINLRPQEALDSLALEISQNFQRLYTKEISSGMIPIPMYIFSLMPLRHASTLQTVGHVQSQIQDMASLHSVDIENMIRRFRQATNRRLALLQDEARREGRSTDIESKNKGNDMSGRSPTSKSFSDDNILEAPYFSADFSSASQHSVVKTFIAYLTARGIKQVKPKGHDLKHYCDSNVKKIPVIVSLSGGVDSMVIANTLAFLRDKCNFPQLHIVAVHIDYGNRPESSAEADFVRRYSNDIVKLEKCVVRRIDEVTRGVTARDQYEKISRMVRYELYRTVAAECTAVCSCDNPSSAQVGVMLGHHRGDLVENVLSNSHKGCGPLDLSGMTDVSTNDGVTLFRPLLPMDKIDIFDYAHKFGVPYFKDTTPHWSTRGKLRNKLLPLLQEIYGDGSLSNLAALAKESDEARALFCTTALQPFMDKVTFHPMGMTFHTAPFKDQSPYFWKIVLRDVLHSGGRGMFGDKTIISFLERVLVKKIKPGWLQCRKDYGVYLNDEGKVYVFHPESFPWRKSDYYDCIGQVVKCNDKHPTQIGPWFVSAERANNPSESSETLLGKKAVESWDDLMKGCIEYYIEVPQNSSENDTTNLIFVEQYSRQSRPIAWRNTDLKIQATLPLLCYDKDSLTSDTKSTIIVRVTLRLQ